ncbi:YihY/virulence factor BrkB family protein [Defluviimonas sp. WL0024]|uniref:YihY/virulence factor BrkB family protein n=1 Tax=Albidovulum salinarum TaxID=2984153 RepID=A0ABT2X8F7_9RHOB|nr:YihY/virulence factor BrkB family protein [Defluviimonas sp. WL0024]MCU9850232.1 YihY/virulence factor BrkB family protein [Defluviimonas sp. WL0024]
MLAAARRVWERMDGLNLSLIAAGVGFFTVLAMFPALGLVVLLWSLIAEPSQIRGLLDSAQAMMPAPVHDIFAAQVSTLIHARSNNTLGWATLVTSGFATWSALSGIASLVRGINAAYGIEHRPGVLRRVLSAAGLTLALCGPGLLAVAMIVVAPVALTFIHLGPVTAIIVAILRWTVALAVVIFAFALIYRYAPNRRGRRPAWLTAGAVLAGFVWLAMSVGFSIYLTNFGNYNKVYGSLGAAVALFMWFYLSAYVVLIGAAFNAQLDHVRANDGPARM